MKATIKRCWNHDGGHESHQGEDCKSTCEHESQALYLFLRYFESYYAYGATCIGRLTFLSGTNKHQVPMSVTHNFYKQTSSTQCFYASGLRDPWHFNKK